MKTGVMILNTTVFGTCLTWREKQIDKMRNNYLSMNLLLDTTPGQTVQLNMISHKFSKTRIIGDEGQQIVGKVLVLAQAI